MYFVSQIRQILSLPCAKPISDDGIQVEPFISNRPILGNAGRTQATYAG